MNPLRSPRAMLLAFVVLMAAPSWATTATLALAALSLAGRGIRALARRWIERRSPPAGSILLGATGQGRVMLSDRELSAHGLILGASGSGKTTALLTILDQQIRRGLPVVAIDMKGSPTFAAQLAAAAAAAGRPFKLWTPDGPSVWNPLQHGNATEGKDKLIATERFSEPHYQRAAERYLQSLLQVLSHARPGRPPTLEEVVELMDPDRLPALLRHVPQDLADRVQDYRAGLTPDQLSAIRGLQTRLAVITESEAAKFLKPGGPHAAALRGELEAICVRGGPEAIDLRGEPEAIDLRAALEGREVVLFSLNSSRYGKFAAQLGTLAVQDLICASGLRLETQAGVPGLALVAIDEFSGIGSEHVVPLFARGREAGLGVLVATQEMADLDRAGRGVRDQVIGSTALKLILRQDVPESAQTVAQIAGTERTWEETRQLGSGTLFAGPRGRGTRREVDRFIIHPNQVKSLRTGEAVLISKLRDERAQVIRVTPTAAPIAAPTAARTVVVDERDRFAFTMNANRSRSGGRVADARPEGVRAERTSPSGRAPRRRYPDPGVTR